MPNLLNTKLIATRKTKHESENELFEEASSTSVPIVPTRHKVYSLRVSEQDHGSNPDGGG